MSALPSGAVQVSISLGNKFTAGTAGSATEQNTFGQTPIQITSGSGIEQYNDVWSIQYTNLNALTTIDLTNLAGVGGRVVNFPDIKLLVAINFDTTAGHDVKFEPGATNGFAAAWNGGTTGEIVPGGSTNGNTSFKSNHGAAGWTVDATHKTISLDPGANTISKFVLVIAG